MWSEGQVDVDGVRVRYVEAGQGPPLVHLPGAGGVGPTPADELLARRFRVIVLDAAPAASGRVIERLGLDAFDLLATGDASAEALRLALNDPERVRALVLEGPTAISRDADLQRRLPEVTTPTLVVFGTADGREVQDTGRVYAQLMPNGHLVFVYDAGRTIGQDRPEAFVDVVADFLEHHEAFIINRAATVIHP